MDSDDDIDGVNDADLLSAASGLPTLPNLRAEDPDRFAQAIRSLVERRAQNGWPGEDDGAEVGAFVLVARPREFRHQFDSDPIMDPSANRDPVLGRLLLLTRDGGHGEVMALPCSPNELVDWLIGNGLGNAPLVIAYRPGATMTVRRAGVNGDVTHQDEIRDTPPNATLGELQRALERFHLAHLLIPSSCVKGVWEPKRAAAYVPGPQPERSIQDGLAIALNFWFQGVLRAEVEDATRIGRIDIRLLMAVNGAPLSYWAIIELKVIKSFANAEDGVKPAAVGRPANIEAINEGLRQARAFASNRQTMGVLEVFDLRNDKSDNLFADADVQGVLSSLSPVPLYFVRPLFGSAKEARQAGFSGA
jgi:hypothetical protein